MLVGSDGKPLPDIIGAPTLEGMTPFTPEEMKMVAEPLRQALAAGIDMMAPCTVEFGVMARLATTVMALQTPLPALLRPGAEEE
jgi:hypothetical protein